ncbi:MAG: hypothetical protein ACOCU6_02935 [Nanoarchaeota archaeon]
MVYFFETDSKRVGQAKRTYRRLESAVTDEISLLRKGVQDTVKRHRFTEKANTVMLKGGYNLSMIDMVLSATKEGMNTDTATVAGMIGGAGIVGINYVLEKYVQPRKQLLKIMPKGKKVSRIATGVLATGFVLSSIFAMPHAKNIGDNFNKTSQEQPSLKKPYAGTTIMTGNLAGRKVGDLYSLYLGKGRSSTTILDTINVDFNKAMKRMWKEKERISPGNPAIQQMINGPLLKYDTKNNTFLNLETYISKAEDITKSMNTHINTDKIQTVYNLNEAQAKLTKQVMSEIGGRELMAYALTELCPSSDGKLNAEYMNMLLEHAGKEFVENIPALADNLLSFGPFQFTSFALYDMNGEQRGASRFQDVMDKTYIEGSIIKLNGNDHIEAAYLFAGNNIAQIIKGLDERAMKNLENNYKRNINEITKIIATSHHAENAVKPWARQWIRNGATENFTIYAKGRFITYSKKTEVNYSALKTYK